MTARVGQLVDGRFLLGDRVGAGGMGVVYRAHDVDADRMVAIKVLASSDEEQGLRFVREARVLATLEHAAIVDYVAHGVTEAGELFLAMEWLEGQDLARRLSAGPLTVVETLDVLEAVAAALCAAHSAGIVHRDIKPSNVFLSLATPSRPVRLVDFGVARTLHTARPLTAARGMIGTPAYMAPEQVHGAAGPSADLFALGCLAYECLTGRAAFEGETVMAVIAKTLFAEVPPLPSELGVPRELDRLVVRLLAKEPAERPADVLEVLESLRAARFAPAPSAVSRAVVSMSERRFVTVVAGHGAEARMTASTLPVPRGSAALPTGPGGVRVQVIGVDGVVAIFRGSHAAEEATRAARYALLLRDRCPDLGVVVTTGRAVTGASVPTGDAIDRAVSLLQRPRPGTVSIDDTTAELLDHGARLRREDDAIELLALTSTEPVGIGRLDFVGRSRELSFLLSTLEECAEEGSSRAVLVTAEAGMGKSALRRELVRRLRSSASVGRAWLARGEGAVDPSPLQLLRQLVERAVEPEATAALDRGLGAHLATLALAESGSIVEVALRDLLGLPPAPDESPGFASIRRDAQEWLTLLHEGLDQWARAAVRAGPLTLVIEDAHWADDASLRVLGRWLTRFADAPLAVIAFSRPEGRQRVADAWSTHEVPELRLPPLARGACRQLVRGARPDEDDAHVEELVNASAGHPLLLEELLRSGGSGSAPRLEALIESRLERLAADDRRILRAASVLGERFAAEAVAAVAQVDAGTVGGALERAARRELVRQTGVGSTWAFWHAIVRDGAYALLTTDDRLAAHLAAADWLEAHAPAQLAELADHLERAVVDDAIRERTVDALLELGARQGDPNAEADTLARAAKHAETMDDRGRHERVMLRVFPRWCNALSHVNRAEARASSERWLELAERSGRPFEEARALSSAAFLDAGGGALELAAGRVARALERLVGAPADVVVEVESHLSLVAYYTGDLEALCEHGVRAAEAGIACGDLRRAATALHNAADGFLRLGRLPEAEAHIERSKEVEQRLEVVGRGVGSVNERLLAMIRLSRGDRDALSTLAHFVGEERSRDAPWFLGEALLFLGIGHALAGERAAALAVLEELLSVAAEAGHVRLREEAIECIAALERGRMPWFRGGTPPA